MEKIVLTIAILAIITSLVPLFLDKVEKRIIEANLKNAIKKFKIGNDEIEKRLLLKGLLRLKTENPEFKLEYIKRIHSTLFTKEKLIETLYDC